MQISPVRLNSIRFGAKNQNLSSNEAKGGIPAAIKSAKQTEQNVTLTNEQWKELDSTLKDHTSMLNQIIAICMCKRQGLLEGIKSENGGNFFHSGLIFPDTIRDYRINKSVLTAAIASEDGFGRTPLQVNIDNLDIFTQLLGTDAPRLYKRVFNKQVNIDNLDIFTQLLGTDAPRLYKRVFNKKDYFGSTIMDGYNEKYFEKIIKALGDQAEEAVAMYAKQSGNNEIYKRYYEVLEKIKKDEALAKDAEVK